MIDKSQGQLPSPTRSSYTHATNMLAPQPHGDSTNAGGVVVSATTTTRLPVTVTYRQSGGDAPLSTSTEVTPTEFEFASGQPVTHQRFTSFDPETQLGGAGIPVGNRQQDFDDIVGTSGRSAADHSPPGYHSTLNIEDEELGNLTPEDLQELITELTTAFHTHNQRTPEERIPTEMSQEEYKEKLDTKKQRRDRLEEYLRTKGYINTDETLEDFQQRLQTSPSISGVNLRAGMQFAIPDTAEEKEGPLMFFTRVRRKVGITSHDPMTPSVGSVNANETTPLTAAHDAPSQAGFIKTYLKKLGNGTVWFLSRWWAAFPLSVFFCLGGYASGDVGEEGAKFYLPHFDWLLSEGALSFFTSQAFWTSAILNMLLYGFNLYNFFTHLDVFITQLNNSGKYKRPIRAAAASCAAAAFAVVVMNIQGYLAKQFPGVDLHDINLNDLSSKQLKHMVRVAIMTFVPNAVLGFQSGMPTALFWIRLLFQREQKAVYDYLDRVITELYKHDADEQLRLLLRASDWMRIAPSTEAEMQQILRSEEQDSAFGLFQPSAKAANARKILYDMIVTEIGQGLTQAEQVYLMMHLGRVMNVPWTPTQSAWRYRIPSWLNKALAGIGAGLIFTWNYPLSTISVSPYFDKNAQAFNILANLLWSAFKFPTSTTFTVIRDICAVAFSLFAFFGKWALYMINAINCVNKVSHLPATYTRMQHELIETICHFFPRYRGVFINLLARGFTAVILAAVVAVCLELIFISGVGYGNISRLSFESFFELICKQETLEQFFEYVCDHYTDIVANIFAVFAIFQAGNVNVMSMVDLLKNASYFVTSKINGFRNQYNTCMASKGDDAQPYGEANEGSRTYRTKCSATETLDRALQGLKSTVTTPDTADTPGVNTKLYKQIQNAHAREEPVIALPQMSTLHLVEPDDNDYQALRETHRQRTGNDDTTIEMESVDIQQPIADSIGDNEPENPPRHMCLMM